MKKSLESNKISAQKIIDEYCEFFAVTHIFGDHNLVKEKITSIATHLTINQFNFIDEKIRDKILLINENIEKKLPDDQINELLINWHRIINVNLKELPDQKFIYAIKSSIPEMIFSSDLPENKYDKIRPTLNIEFARAFVLDSRKTKGLNKTAV